MGVSLQERGHDEHAEHTCRYGRFALHDGKHELGGTSFSATALFRSVDSGRSFSSLFVESTADMRAMTMRKLAGRRATLFVVGNIGRLTTWRWDETH